MQINFTLGLGNGNFNWHVVLSKPVTFVLFGILWWHGFFGAVLNVGYNIFQDLVDSQYYRQQYGRAVGKGFLSPWSQGRGIPSGRP